MFLKQYLFNLCDVFEGVRKIPTWENSHPVNPPIFSDMGKLIRKLVFNKDLLFYKLVSYFCKRVFGYCKTFFYNYNVDA